MYQLIYKLDIPQNKRIYLIFLVIQLKLAFFLANNLFHCLHPHHPLLVFINGNTNIFKFFKIDCLLNKRTIKKAKDQIIEYFVY